MRRSRREANGIKQAAQPNEESWINAAMWRRVCDRKISDKSGDLWCWLISYFLMPICLFVYQFCLFFYCLFLFMICHKHYFWCMVNNIPISFDYKDKYYDGHWDEISGAAARTWYLTINKYHYRQLLFVNDRFVFYSNSKEMEVIAELFGEHLMLWYQ